MPCRLLIALAALAALPACTTGMPNTGPAPLPATDYSVVPADKVDTVNTANRAFMRRDVEAIGAELDEDFQWYTIGPDGVKLMVRGKDETMGRLKGFFAMTDWTGAEVQQLGMLGNILIQVEVDHFNGKDGEQTVESLSIYELRDGKRWREWKFYPLPAGQ